MKYILSIIATVLVMVQMAHAGSNHSYKCYVSPWDGKPNNRINVLNESPMNNKLLIAHVDYNDRKSFKSRPDIYDIRIEKPIKGKWEDKRGKRVKNLYMYSGGSKHNIFAVSTVSRGWTKGFHVVDGGLIEYDCQRAKFTR